MSKICRLVLLSCRSSPLTRLWMLQMRREGDLVCGYNPWTHRREAVETLAAVPLLVPMLDVPGADVVEHRVTKDVVRRVLGLDAVGILA